MKSILKNTYLAFILSTVILVSGSIQAGVLAGHQAVDDFDNIPAFWVSAVNDSLVFYYLHQSHGSQVIQGMKMLYTDDNAFVPPEMWAQWWVYPGGCQDIGWNGDTCFVDWTRDFLDTTSSACNIVSVSFSHSAMSCDSTETHKFVRAWVNLANDYPNIDFVLQNSRLMTESDNFATTGTYILRTNQNVRDIWADYNLPNLHLLDVGDIAWWDRLNNEIDSLSTDLGNTWFPAYVASGYTPLSCEESNLTFGGSWHLSMMGNTDGCSHAEGGSYGCLKCELLGKAWWYMMARVAGWEPNPPSCGDMTLDGFINVDDGMYLVNYIFRAGPAPPSLNYGDVNNDSRVNIGDVVHLIQYIFSTGSAPDCP